MKWKEQKKGKLAERLRMKIVAYSGKSSAA